MDLDDLDAIANLQNNSQFIELLNKKSTNVGIDMDDIEALVSLQN